MNDRLAPRIGAVMSADIAVPRHQRVAEFYSAVLTTGDTPLWREDLMNNRGVPVIGVGERIPEYTVLPVQWMPHIQVTDVEQSVERALAMGGREALHNRDDNGTSQWAVLLDPDGAAFGLIPCVADAAQEYPGASPDTSGNTGCIAWLDLTVPDGSGRRDFYSEVVGWMPQDVGMNDQNGTYADYVMLDAGGNAAAGVCHARGLNAGLPPVWLLYLPVGDLAESLRRVRDGGGRIIRDRSGGGDEFEFAVVQDPAGAFVALVAG